jgi:putative transposase
MVEYTHGNHNIHDIKYHFVWIMKYRYKALTKPIAERLRELLRQGCVARGITIDLFKNRKDAIIKEWDGEKMQGMPKRFFLNGCAG